MRTVILDEIHAVAGTKRGTHLITAVERLARLTAAAPGGVDFQRVALSATVRPVERAAAFVGGYRRTAAGGEAGFAPRPVTIVRSGESKRLELAVRSIPEAREGDPLWIALAGELKGIAKGNRSTLVFVNSRRLAEKLSRLMNEGEERELAYAHHGSLSREVRLAVERRLKDGQLPAVIATNSLELGIDVGDLDQVVLVQTPFTVASGLQRIGRAGHSVGRVSRGLLFPTHGLDGLEAAVMVPAILDQEIEELHPPLCPLDVLAQVLLAMSGTESWDAEELFAEVRCAWPFHTLEREQFDRVLEMLAGRYADSRVRELRPRLHLDVETGRVRARDGALQLVLQAGGTIPDRGYLELRVRGAGPGPGARIGELDEEFVWERRVGDTFTLGNQSWRIARIGDREVEVAPWDGPLNTLPFWRAERQSRDFGFCERIGRLLERWEGRLEDPGFAAELRERGRLDETARERLTAFLARQQAACGGMLPHRRRVLVERCSGAAGEGRGSAPAAGGEAGGGARCRGSSCTPSGGGGSTSRWPCCCPRSGRSARAGRWRCSSTTTASCCSCLRRRTRPTCCAGRRPPRSSGCCAAGWRAAAFSAPASARTPAGRCCCPAPASAAGCRSGSPACAPGGCWRRSPATRTSRSWRRPGAPACRTSSTCPPCAPCWTSCCPGRPGWRRSTPPGLPPSPRGWSGASSTGTSTPATPRRRPGLPRSGRTSSARRPAARSCGPPSSRGSWRSSRPVSSAWRRAGRPATPTTCWTGCGSGSSSRRRSGRSCRRRWRGTPAAAPRQKTGKAAPVRAARSAPSRRPAAWPGCGRRARPPQAAAWRGSPPATGCPACAAPWRRRGRRRAPAPTGVPSPEARMPPQDAAGGDPLSGLLAEWLRAYGPLPRERLSAVFGLPEERLGPALEELAGRGEIVVDRLTRGAAGPEVCDAENLERLLRLQRARAKPVFRALPAEALPLFLAHWQGLLQPGGSAADLPAALEKLFGWCAPAELWEAELLPARLSPYYSHWLDALFRESELAWYGCGRGRIGFCPLDDYELVAEGAADAPSAAGADAAAGEEAFPGSAAGRETGGAPPGPVPPAGRHPFRELLAGSGLRSDRLTSLLWEGVWAGRLSNDSPAALRRGIETRFRGEPPPAAPGAVAPVGAAGVRARPGRAALGRWRASRPGDGNWFRLPAAVPQDAALDPLEREELNRDRARLLLQRYGLLFRELLEAEAAPLRWAALFRTLRLMELSGEVLAGHFFQGIPGMQFLSHAAWRALQKGLPEEEVWLLNAADPASLCGRRPEGFPVRLPPRLPTTHLFSVGRRLAVVSKRKGRELEILLPPDDPGLGRCLRRFGDFLRRDFRPWRSVRVETVNGVACRDSPFAGALQQAGFQPDYTAFILRG